MERFLAGVLVAVVGWLVWDRLKGESARDEGVEDQIVRAWLRENGAVEVKVDPVPEAPDFLEPIDERDPFDHVFPDQKPGPGAPWYLEAGDLPESIADVEITADMNGRATYMSGDGKEVAL